MHVAIDARLIHYQQAGIAVYVSSLVDSLADMADSTKVTVLLSRKDKSSCLATANRFQKIRMWTPCHNRCEQLTLPLELLGRGIDLLHSPDFIPPFRRRCKSVITIHDLAFLLYPDSLTEESRRYYSQVYHAAQSADVIIAVSNSTKRDIVERLGVAEDKVLVVYHGVDPVYRPAEDTCGLEDFLLRFGIKSPFILFVGTLEPRKNLTTLLDAFAAVASIFVDERNHEGRQTLPQLVIAGRKGWLYDDIFSRIEALGVSDRVIFTDQVGREDLVALYNAATFVVQPSIYEGFGLPALEALACGTPCIVSNTSSLPEVVGDAAIMVDPLDGQGWTETMRSLFESADLRRELSHKGLARSKQFTWARAARQTLEIYRLAVGGAIRS